MKHALVDRQVLVDRLPVKTHTGKRNHHNHQCWGIENHKAGSHKAKPSPPNPIHARLQRSYHPYKIVPRGRLRLIIDPVTQWTVKMVTQKPPFQAFAVENMQTLQLADFFRSVHLVQAHGTADVSCPTPRILILGSHQTNWPSTASERPILPLVSVHHSPRVRVGETASRLASRSSGFFLERRKA